MILKYQPMISHSNSLMASRGGFRQPQYLIIPLYYAVF